MPVFLTDKDFSINRQRKGKLTKNEENSGRKYTQTQTHRNLKYFGDHICDRQNISSFCVFVCTFVRRSLHFFDEFSLSFPSYWDICTLVLSFPHDKDFCESQNMWLSCVIIFSSVYNLSGECFTVVQVWVSIHPWHTYSGTLLSRYFYLCLLNVLEHTFIMCTIFNTYEIILQ